MVIGIVGDAERAVAWERHLRPHNIVRQVVLAPHVHDLDRVDACFILDDTQQRFEHLLDAVKEGIPCFFISDFIASSAEYEQVYRSSKEAGVDVQVAHWPTLSPATQWMKDKILKPQFIQVQRSVYRSRLNENPDQFTNMWMDELALCLKWMDSGIHHLEIKKSSLGPKLPQAIHLMIRFDNGASASIQIQLSSTQEHHIRYLSGKKDFLECQVSQQQVKYGYLGEHQHIHFDTKQFDSTKAAEKAALHFIKNIQLRKEVVYSAYDAFQCAKTYEKLIAKFV
jgi:predicted dehydrogenase